MPYRLEKILKNPETLQQLLGQGSWQDQKAEGLLAAAVLLLLEQGQLWFIQRSSRLRQHAGQIAFPGGKQEPADPDLWHTAVRETYEEIGVDPDRLHPLGRLDEGWTPTGFRIRPYVAWYEGPSLQPSLSSEVERAFRLPVGDLLEMNSSLPWPRYPSEYGEIWGATGRILYQWLELLRKARAPE